MPKWLRICEWSVLVLWACIAVPSTIIYVKEFNDWSGQQEVIWMAVMLAVPMIFPWCVGLLSRIVGASDRLTGDKRFAIVGMLIASVGLSLAFPPGSGLSEPNLLGVFVPGGLQMVAVYLWLRWARGSGEIPAQRLLRSIRSRGSKNVPRAGQSADVDDE